MRESSNRFRPIVFLAPAACLFLAMRGGAAEEPPAQGADRTMALYEYLQVAGIKLDCYFTIEGTPREGESGWIAVCDAKWDMSVSSIDKLTAEVAAKVPGVKVFRSDDNPAVVHVMDKRLAGMADYVLAKKTSITFKGKAQALVDRLHEKCFEELETRTAFLGGGWPPARPPDSTPIVCSARQAAVRRILSDYLPLSQYGRILWLAESRSEDDKLRTTIQYLGGDSYDGPIRLCTAPSDGLAQPAIDFRTGTPMVNGVIPFDYGEIAYRNNPDPDKEELTVNLNDEAIQFINERPGRRPPPPGPLGDVLSRQAQGQGGHPRPSQTPRLPVHHLRRPGRILPGRTGLDDDRRAGGGRNLQGTYGQGCHGPSRPSAVPRAAKREGR